MEQKINIKEKKKTIYYSDKTIYIKLLTNVIKRKKNERHKHHFKAPQKSKTIS